MQERESNVVRGNFISSDELLEDLSTVRDETSKASEVQIGCVQEHTNTHGLDIVLGLEDICQTNTGLVEEETLEFIDFIFNEGAISCMSEPGQGTFCFLCHFILDEVDWRLGEHGEEEQVADADSKQAVVEHIVRDHGAHGEGIERADSHREGEHVGQGGPHLVTGDLLYIQGDTHETAHIAEASNDPGDEHCCLVVTKAEDTVHDDMGDTQDNTRVLPAIPLGEVPPDESTSQGGQEGDGAQPGHVLHGDGAHRGVC